jgi:NAD(P)H-binding
MSDTLLIFCYHLPFPPPLFHVIYRMCSAFLLLLEMYSIYNLTPAFPSQAGSNVGRVFIPLLLEYPEFAITALLRPTSTFTFPSPLISTKLVDFASPDSLVQALHGTDAVLSLVPPSATKFEVQKPVIDAAVTAGVKVYFASEFSADILSAHYAVFPTEVVGDKVESRRYLEKLAKDGRINWMAINGGPFFDMC